MKYNEAYNKIIDAYFKDEIQPYDAQFCFCGTLAYNPLSKRKRSIYTDLWKINNYSNEQLKQMEKALLINIKEGTIGDINDIFCEKEERALVTEHPNYENALFKGMCKALDVLKSIHKERGEQIDEQTTFIKREKQLI